MESISKEEYLESVSRNILPNTKEIDYFKSSNSQYFGVIIEDLLDHDFHIIVHKESHDSPTEEYSFYKGEHGFESYEKAYDKLGKLIN